VKDVVPSLARREKDTGALLKRKVEWKGRKVKGGKRDEEKKGMTVERKMRGRRPEYRERIAGAETEIVLAHGLSLGCWGLEEGTIKMEVKIR